MQMLARSPKIGGKGTYQYAKFLAAMNHVKQWRLALDIGAHVGLWTMHMIERFDTVIAFEPCREHCDCWLENVEPDHSAHLVCAALGNKQANVGLAFEPGSSGGTHIAENGGGTVPIVPLDSFAFKCVDFIKIDVEGYELFVLQGGEQTIRVWKPTILIEQKPKGLAERYGQQRMAAVDLLKRWGATVQFEMSGDFCCTFEAA